MYIKVSSDIQSSILDYAIFQFHNPIGHVENTVVMRYQKNSGV